MVNLSTYTDNYVNPLDMDVWNLDARDSKGWIRENVPLCLACVNSVLINRLHHNNVPLLTGA